MICRNCGLKVPDNEMFCPSCGTKMIPDNNFGSFRSPEKKPFSFLNYKWFAPVAMVMSNIASSVVSIILAFGFTEAMLQLGYPLYLIASAVIQIIIGMIVCAVMYLITTSKFSKEQKQPFRRLTAIPFLLYAVSITLGTILGQIPSLLSRLIASPGFIVKVLFSGISFFLGIALLIASYIIALRYLKSKECEMNSDNDQL